ncbi:hypothetical protein BOX15_Mlig032137g1, partial [Macrostomum lignano]
GFLGNLLIFFISSYKQFIDPFFSMANRQEGREVAGCNQIAHDQIWKDHCTKEASSAKHWHKDWGFMAQSYEEVIKDELPTLRDSSRPKAELPAHMQVPPVTPLRNYLRVDPSPKPPPRTTSQEIGWRSGQRSLALDKYGRDGRPRGSLIGQLKWPAEAIN